MKAKRINKNLNKISGLKHRGGKIMPSSSNVLVVKKTMSSNSSAATSNHLYKLRASRRDQEINESINKMYSREINDIERFVSIYKGK